MSKTKNAVVESSKVNEETNGKAQETETQEETGRLSRWAAARMAIKQMGLATTSLADLGKVAAKLYADSRDEEQEDDEAEKMEGYCQSVLEGLEQLGLVTIVWQASVTAHIDMSKIPAKK